MTCYSKPMPPQCIESPGVAKVFVYLLCLITPGAAIASVIPVSSSLYVHSGITDSTTSPDTTLVVDTKTPAQGNSLGNLSASASAAEGTISIFSYAQATWTSASAGQVILGNGMTDTASQEHYDRYATNDTTFTYTFTTNGPGTVEIDATAWQPEGVDIYPNNSYITPYSMIMYGPGFEPLGTVFGTVGGNEWKLAPIFSDQTNVGYPLKLFDESGQFSVSLAQAGTYTLRIGDGAVFRYNSAINNDLDSARGTFDFNITTAAVPVPAAVWLFGSGLAGLIGISRRKTIA